MSQETDRDITLEVHDGNYFRFDKISCTARKVKPGSKPFSRTHNHRGTYVAIEDGTCTIDKAWRAK